MISFELLHASHECIAALDGLCVVAAGAEASHGAVALYADHAL